MEQAKKTEKTYLSQDGCTAQPKTLTHTSTLNCSSLSQKKFLSLILRILARSRPLFHIDLRPLLCSTATRELALKAGAFFEQEKSKSEIWEKRLRA